MKITISDCKPLFSLANQQSLLLLFANHLPGVCTVNTLDVPSPDPVTRKLPSLQQEIISDVTVYSHE